MTSISLRPMYSIVFRLAVVIGVITGAMSLTSCHKTINKNVVLEMPTPSWKIVEAQGSPVARHEAGMVAIDKKIYLMGGRRVNPTSVFDTVTSTWKNLSAPPLEIHHFQPVVFNNEIYIVGAMTGQWPNETPVKRVIIYNPKQDTYRYAHDIPKSRQRGGAGVVVYKDKLYIVGGIVDGHQRGYQAWLDEYDPNTGAWKALPDAHNARDHFQAAIVDDELYAFAGRTTSHATSQGMSLTVEYGNRYSFETKQWLPVTQALKTPTPRAGNAVFTWGNKIVVVGGESGTQVVAHDEVDAFNTHTQTWLKLPALQAGRHGTGAVVIDNVVYTASGSGNRGGGPELTSIESLDLRALDSTANASDSNTKVQNERIEQQWHSLSLDFNGPFSAELNKINPFLHYKLWVDFTHAATGRTISIPGFFAADGNAANTSADEGSIWRARFTPHLLGKWSYKASLLSGENVALISNHDRKKNVSPATISNETNTKRPITNVPLANNEGTFTVVKSDKTSPDFRANGQLKVKNGLFRFDSGEYWLKGGANSPENLLGYYEFDNTYRIVAKAREGEAAPSNALHEYQAHSKDWQIGDPTWQTSKGKNIIGALNYLSDKGMNAVYFLTMNIGGDGKDVWPYISETAFTRFDVSKLAQWNIVFEHMQSKGILLHIVLQETENETLLDEGDTKNLRQLYINELVARFSHHPGLIWNLGEENGPADWSPIAQNDKQRKDMITHIKTSDPYSHPLVLHTHAYEPPRQEVLNPMLGFELLDGLSLQADKREGVSEVIKRWKRESIASGHEWLITMDEIGMWHTAVTLDSDYPTHDSLRRHVLWGSLLSGAAGVEWYFGANFAHNDLTSEDWRQRDNLWTQTKIALDFFTQHLPYWEMAVCDDNSPTLCLHRDNEITASYVIRGDTAEVTLNAAIKQYQVYWYDPLNGGDLITGKTINININKIANITKVVIEPPTTLQDKDWVLLIKPAT